MKDLIKKIFSKFSEMLGDGTNRWKTVRFALIFTMILSNLSIFGIWSYLSIVKWQLMDIPEGVLYLYGLANGIIIFGKSFEKRVEGKMFEMTQSISTQSTTDSQPTDQK
jgi:hypothetical protein